MNRDSLYYLFCNHWSQCGIGFAFPMGWYGGKRYQSTFSTAYTIHKMLDAADDYPGLKVSLELDAYAYEAVAAEDGQCISRLREYIAQGKAAIDGGTYGQPFGQDYGWESNIRHLTYGRQVIQQHLDYDVKAFLVEEQWFHPQLPQLLLKAGFKYASLQNQNSGQVKPMRDTMIRWRGLDGSSLPTIPANDLMVSCVRQYTDYSNYTGILARYSHPLLFQWVEVWPPGMDWGASCKPFEKAIQQVLLWGARPVSLGEYFELELPHQELRDEYIAMDESNYDNTWYQNGGWGFDGDRVIILDRMAERRLLTLETLACIHHGTAHASYLSDRLKELWKWLLILQNHDSSVARSYRVFNKNGIETNAGSFVIQQYKELMTSAQAEIEGLKLHQEEQANPIHTVWNTNGVKGERTVELDIPVPADLSGLDEWMVEQAGRVLPFQVRERKDDRVRGYTVLSIPGVGGASFAINRDTEGSTVRGRIESPTYGDTWLEDGNYRVEWIHRSWSIRIVDKKRAQEMTVTAFSGSIGKQNEHDGNVYPALSPAHMEFSFAFDGTTHSPDQISRVEAHVNERGPVRSTLALRSDLLTLHTTETSAAFAEARLTVEHLTGRVELELYLYTGVYLSVNAETVFQHNYANARYYRDFPFGEEETKRSDFSATSYVRVTNGSQGLTLVHPGTQKVRLLRETAGDEMRLLINRGRILGEYSWNFGLYFGPHEPHESARLAKCDGEFLSTSLGVGHESEFFEVSDPRVLLSSISYENEALTARFVNYSGHGLTTNVKVARKYTKAAMTNFIGERLKDVALSHAPEGTLLTLSVQPWEVVHLVFQ